MVAIRVLVLCAALALVACAAQAPRDIPSYRLVGYVLGPGERPRIDAEELTAINYAFGHIDAHGEVALGAGDGEFLARLRELKTQNPRLELVLSVGGWGADGFSDAALSDASRTRFADSVARVLAQYDLDGVDLDWEYPGLPGPGIVHRPEDRRDFSLLLETLRRRLDVLARERGRTDHYLITAALADGEFVANIELSRVGAVLDWVNLMTYDFHNSLTTTTGHHSALHRSATSAASERSVESAVAQFLAAGVPARKVVVGVPFYGRGFADVAANNRGLDQVYGHYAGEFPWSQLVTDFIEHDGYVRYWDAAAQEPYLWNARSRTFVSYDDPQSLARKVEFVKARHLGGMMFWEQSQDPQAELLDVLANGLRQRGRN